MNIQDFEIITISTDKTAAQVKIQLCAPIGIRYLMTLHGVKAFRAEDLAMQNEIGQALFSTMHCLDKDAIAHWIDWATSFSDSRSWLYEDKRIEWITSCLAGNLELVIIIPAIGAQLAAVCDHVDLIECAV